MSLWTAREAYGTAREAYGTAREAYGTAREAYVSKLCFADFFKYLKVYQF